jgi:ribosomal protein S18 acetylase RimI-like enzyme
VTVTTRGGPWAERAGPGEAEIRMLVVDPGVRGAGTGEALVRACIARAARDGCTGLRLSTEPTMTTAHRLYERLGFVRAPDHDWQPVPDVTLLGYELTLERS